MARRRAQRLLLVFAAILLCVLAVVAVTVSASRMVAENTDELTRLRIPELQHMSALEQAMAERANQLYLYYATTERAPWQAINPVLAEQAHTHLAALNRLGLSDQARRDFIALILEFDGYGHAFDQVMQAAPRDWDVLREHLGAAQVVLEKMHRELADWRALVSQAANLSGEVAQVEVTQLSRLQVAFSVAVLLVAAFVLVALHARLKDQDALYRQAYFDDLTGLPNRRHLEKDLAGHLQAAHPGCLMVLQISRYRRIARTFGHATADQLLLAHVGQLQRVLGDTSGAFPLYRLNTDTLALVCLHSVSHAAAEQRAAALLAIQSETLVLEAREFQAELRLGLCLFPSDGEDVDCLIRNADAAMHAAIEGGPAVAFSRRMAQDSADWLAMESALRQALQVGTFELYYQPKLCARTETLCAAEALIRWRQDGQLISPGQFIPVAEESGLSIPLGTWVLREACRQWRAWQQSGARPLPVAVNISTQQFSDPAFPALVASTLAEFEIPTGMIELEITEAVAASDPEQVVQTLQTLKATGVTLAIDDFGTGYSSLAYLQRFPIDTLKIDQAFVRRLGEDPEAAAIIELIQGLAQALDLKVVAEGVETVAQKEFLQAAGCTQLQGYLFSKPLPVAEFTRWLPAL